MFETRSAGELADENLCGGASEGDTDMPEFAALSGAHIVRGADPRRPGPSIGHVTSTTYSPTLACNIALALVENGPALHGETVYAADPVRGSHGPVEIRDPHFYDPDGIRMHG